MNQCIKEKKIIIICQRWQNHNMQIIDLLLQFLNLDVFSLFYVIVVCSVMV